MQPATHDNLIQLLGEWPPENIERDMQQLLRLENSSDSWHLLLPNPHKEITVLARPGGLQFMSTNKQERADFALPFTQLQQIRLLPSSTVVKGAPFYWLYTVPTTFLFLLMGISNNQELTFFWMVLGFTLGCVLSAHYHKRYRRNLQMVYTDGQQQTQTLLFSIPPKQEKQAIRFFQSYTAEQFVIKVL